MDIKSITVRLVNESNQTQNSNSSTKNLPRHRTGVQVQVDPEGVTNLVIVKTDNDNFKLCTMNGYVLGVFSSEKEAAFTIKEIAMAALSGSQSYNLVLRKPKPTHSTDLSTTYSDDHPFYPTSISHKYNVGIIITYNDNNQRTELFKSCNSIRDAHRYINNSLPNLKLPKDPISFDKAKYTLETTKAHYTVNIWTQ